MTRKQLLVLILFSILCLPVQAQIGNDEQIIIDLATDAMTNDNTARAVGVTGGVVAEISQWSGTYAYGTVVTRVPDGIHGGPDLRVFVAVYEETGWRVALEWTPEFGELLLQSPPDLVPFDLRMALINSDMIMRSELRGLGESRLSLPFPEFQSWTLSGGPHGDGGNAYRPWSALDLSLMNSAGTLISAEIRAAREGVVVRMASCPNLIVINHADGWQTGYYHVNNEQVVNGQTVQRGQLLGYTSNNVGCGGWSSGPHVHFTLRRYGVFQNIHGHDVGGWTVNEGSAAYAGCMMRVRDEYWRCRGAMIYNDGSIGSGFADRRYDFNRDRKPDLWAVNMRDTVANKTSVQIASGASLFTMLVNNASGMPQQPDYLNTAFAAGDYDRNSTADLWVIHRLDGSEKTAVRIMGGGENFAYLYADKITALPAFDNSVSFAVTDYNRDGYPDLWAIVPRDPVLNKVVVKIAAGPDFQTVMIDTATSAAAVSAYQDINFAAADYNNDGYPDLWLINPRHNNSERTAVTVISGKDFQTTLLNRATAFRMMSTDINSYGYSVSDYNRDSYPDLWWIDRKRNKVRILSGADFTTMLYAGGSALPKTNTLNWQVLGSDRARETIAPQIPTLQSPIALTPINSPNTVFTWKPSGLASQYVLTLRDKFGNIVIEKGLADGWAYCKKPVCSISTQKLGILLRDNQQYTWHITASNAYGVSASITDSFTTEIPGASELKSPPSGTVFDLNDLTTASNGITLTWGTRPDADSYTLIVRGLDTPYVFKKGLLKTECGVNNCSFTLPTALATGNYQWVVTARNVAVKGTTKSAVWKFSVIAPTIELPSP